MNGSQKERPGADTALGTRDGEAIVQVQDGCLAIDEIVGVETTQQADGVEPEIEAAKLRTTAGRAEVAAHSVVAIRRRSGQACRQYCVPRKRAKVPTDFRREARRGCAVNAARQLGDHVERGPVLGADRVAETLRRGEAQTEPASLPLSRHRDRLFALGAVEVVARRTGGGQHTGGPSDLAPGKQHAGSDLP